jgi:putative ABC transport system permease protein
MVRTSEDPVSVFNALRANIETVAGRKIEGYGTLDEALLRTVHLPRFRTRLFGLLGVLVLILMAVGIFSVTAHGVVQRRRELGIRLAIGATQPQIVRLVLRETSAPLLIGIGLGLLGSLSATRVISGFLYSTTPTDPLTFALVISVVALTGLLAAWIPTRRTIHIDPVAVLKAE